MRPRDKAPAGFKTCSKCGKVKPLSEFGTYKHILRTPGVTNPTMQQDINRAVRRPNAACQTCR